MRTPFESLPDLQMTVPSGDSDNPAIPKGDREPPQLSSHAPDPSVVDEDKPNLESTTTSTTKSLLRGVSESANAYLPLKTIAQGLCLILDNCKV